MVSYHVAVSPQTINQGCRTIGSHTLPSHVNRPQLRPENPLITFIKHTTLLKEPRQLTNFQILCFTNSEIVIVAVFINSVIFKSMFRLT